MMKTTRFAVPSPKPLGDFTIVAMLVVLVAAVPGCGKPSSANIALRKENKALRDKVESLERQHNADVASLRAGGATTVPSLPQTQLEKLFTVHGIEFGRLTGPADWDANAPGDDGLKLYVTPTDNAGQPLKAAGSFVVEAFDLAAGDGRTRVGRWEFPLDDAAKNWFGQATLYTYVLQTPWQTRPEHPDLTLKVTFTDALTGRSFTEQKVVKITPSSAAAPVKK